MDKKATAEDIIGIQTRNDKKPMKNSMTETKNKGCQKFEIDRNEFPSLNEISTRIAARIGNQVKNPLDGNKSFSYSEKLKRAPTESRSCFRFEAANQEHSGTNTAKSPDKYHSANNFERKIPLAVPQTNAATTNDRCSLNARNGIFSGENSQKPNSQVARKEKFVMPERSHQVLNSQSFLNRTENGRRVEIFHNAGPSTSQAKLGASNIQRSERNISRVQRNNKEAKPDQGDLRPTEVKKKKKRKSKIKRYAALQTGKISVLTPEAHSRIVNKSNAASFKPCVNAVVNINDCEEYPELGTTSVAKPNKENSAKIEVTTKDTFASGINELEAVELGSNSVAPQPISAIKEILEGVKEDGEKIAKASDSEKTPVLLKDPITLTLFDILSTAKARKKEPEKKNESAVLESPSKVKSSKVLGKKEVYDIVNPLDSSRPAVKRGKEREKPRVKKPSRMRKLILMGRQLKREEMTHFEESEKSDAVYNNCQSPSISTDSVKGSFNQKSTCLNGNTLSRENESFGSKVSSDENSSGNSFSNEECQGISMEQSKSKSICEILSNDYRTDTSSAVESESSNTFSTNDPEKELKKIESNGEKSLHIASNESCSSQELDDLSDFKELDGLSSFWTLESHSDVSEEVKCTLDDISIYNENENQDFIVRKNERSAFVEKCIGISQPSPENYRAVGNLSTYQSFSKYNVRDDEVTKQENLSIDLNSDVDGNVTDDVLDLEMSASSCSVNDKDASRLAVNSLNSEVFLGSRESQKGSLKDLIENAPCFDHLSKQVKNVVLGSGILDEKTEAVKTIIHSRKFRKYCNHFVSKEIDKVVFALLDDLARFQDRMHQKDPVKARVRKRLLYGIKEIKRHMKLKKLKGIILATDIEDIRTEGGLNDVVNEIISLAEAYHIPYIFSHRRFNLGKVCRKSVAVSCVGIFNYEGSEKNFKRILELQEESKHDYLAVTEALNSLLSSTQITEVLKLGKGVPEKLHEMRGKILREHFKPDTNKSECDVNVLPEVLMNATNSDTSVCKSLFTEAHTSASTEINKNEIYNILTKYSVI